MTPLKTLLVDDEFLALQLLENYIQQTPQLTVIDRVKSPLRALEILQTTTIDLLFLDIQMPLLAGTQLVKTLQRPPLTVFTTAYADYAVEGFELNAVDYLLKPFSFDRFLQAVNKSVERFQSIENQKVNILATPTMDFLTVKVDGTLRKIFYHDILWIEGLKEYIRFHCTTGKFIVFDRLKNLESTLPAREFIRVHKSYIVAKSKVEALTGNRLQIGGQYIPISRGKREVVLRGVFG